MKQTLFSILFLLVPIWANADPVEINGIYYNLVSKLKTAEVTSNPSTYSGDIVIPKSVVYGGVTYSVTSIGMNAFSRCSGLTSLTIPNSVTSIGGSAFSGCSGLTSVTIPNSVTSIGGSAFSGCSGLTSVTIPNSVTEISEYVFSSCSSLTSLTIPNSVTSIGNYTFHGCTGLTSVTIPNSVTKIGDYAFFRCSSLTSVTIPNSVTSIGKGSFCDCTGLISVTIPNSVISIGGWAFSDCSSLTSVTIPNSVTSIGVSAFDSCSSLTSVTIPNSVTSIGDCTFEGCSGLTSVTIPNSVTSIGISAFDGCSSLTSLTIPNSVISIGGSAFYRCSGLTSVTIPNSVISIDGWAFCHCSGLTSVTIPNSVTSIESGAFENCSGLTSVTIGTGIQVIGSLAFAKCPELTDVFCYAENVPNTFSDAFQNSYIDFATLHVPNASINIYKTTDPWSGFGSFEGTYNSVVINKSEAILEKGKTMTLKATVSSEIEDKSVTWKSSSSAVATVSSKGKVKGVKAGIVTITCTSVTTGAKATCKVTVGYVKLDKTEAILENGETMTLTPTVYPSKLTDKSVTWKSSDETIAKVTSSGEVTGINAGTATITCTSVATGLSTTCTVTVVSSVTLDKAEVILKKGKTMTLKATVSPEIEDKSVTWKSSDKTIATVTSTGKVKGVKSGVVTITCTSVATGAKATCKVTVGTITLNKSSVTIKKGKTFTLMPTVYPTTLEDKSVTWKSSDESIATVTSAGKVKGVKSGTATITCTSNATGLSTTCKVTVGTVILNLSQITINKGKTVTLEADVYPTTLEDQSVTWKSSDETIATVSSDGKVNGVAAGTATITCTSVATGLSATCKVTVTDFTPARTMLGDDDEVTDIEMVEETPAAEDPYDVYDLKGHRVLHQVTSLDGLPAGVYIVKGKKVLKK